MKKYLKLLVFSLVILGVLAVAGSGIALAAAPVNPTGNPCNGGYYGNGGQGMVSLDTVSKLLGMTTAEIQAQRQAGQSLVQIAATKNVSEDTLVKAILEAKKAALDQAVQAGTITREQADWRLQQMEQQVHQAVNRTTTGAPEWRGAGGNAGGGRLTPGTAPGMMRGGWGRTAPRTAVQ